MTRIVQISDLHFGREDPDLLRPLTEAIAEAAPDLVVMAGDFVQRARGSQFRAARAFMTALDVPWMGVPGNHDIPLFNIAERLISPYRAYRRWIAEDLEPVLRLDGVDILGIDTSDPFAHQRGRVSPGQIRRIGQAIEASGDRLVVIVAHHPFHHAADVEKKLMIGAPDALAHWAGCGPHVIMSGHLHRWLFEPFASREGANMTLQLHCGTGLSSRRRGQPNDFAILDWADQTASVTRMVANGARFAAEDFISYEATDAGWRKRS